MGWVFSRLNRPGVCQSTPIIIFPTVFFFFNKTRDGELKLEAPEFGKFLVVGVAFKKLGKATPNSFLR